MRLHFLWDNNICTRLQIVSFMFTNRPVNSLSKRIYLSSKNMVTIIKVSSSRHTCEECFLVNNNAGEAIFYLVYKKCTLRQRLYIYCLAELAQYGEIKLMLFALERRFLHVFFLTFNFYNFFPTLFQYTEYSLKLLSNNKLGTNSRNNCALIVSSWFFREKYTTYLPTLKNTDVNVTMLRCKPSLTSNVILHKRYVTPGDQLNAIHG